MHRALVPVWLAVAIVSLASATAVAGDEPGRGEGKLILFASAEGYSLDSDYGPYDDTDGVLTADIVGSWSRGRFRVFGELLVSTEEQEMERLQLGWQLAPETFAWLGRFHQPSSVWNSLYHHGQYLQPSITRPAIEDWEDDGGILPQHVEGLLFETRRPLGSGDSHGFVLAAAGGIGPILTRNGLEPYEVFSSRTHDRRPAFGLRLMYLPDFTDDDGVGIVASHAEIGLDEIGNVAQSDHVDLDAYGVFVSWTSGPWQARGTVYRIRAGYDAPDPGSDQFWAGYVQVSRELGGEFTLLARYEDSDGASDSRYVRYFPDFVEERAVVNLRWDFSVRQALAVELASSKAREGRFRELRVQWSAAFQ